MTRLLFPLLALSTIFLASCSNTSNKLDNLEISETQRQREVFLDWYGYRIDSIKATKALNLKTQTESELITYCEFFKNVADTNSAY